MTIDRKSIVEVEFKSAPGSFRATIATLGVVDKDGDVILPGAFKDGAAIVVSAYQHTSWSGALPVGSAVLTSNGQKAWADGQFFQTNPGKDTYETVKALAAKGLGEWSFGYSVKAGSVIPEELSRYPGAKRIIAELDCYEASPVLVGAGIGTGTDYIKAAAAAPSDAELAAWRDGLELAQVKVNLDRLTDELDSRDVTTYSEVESAWVPQETKRLAGLTLLVACADLGIPAPHLRWMRPGLPGPDEKSITASVGAYGIARKGEIWLDHRLTGFDLVEVVAHEAKHHAIGISGVPHEREAKAYGLAARRDWRVG